MIAESPTFDPAEGEVYAETLDTLQTADVGYMLGGALALHAHTGIWRDTKDLDVFMPQGSVARALEHWTGRASRRR